MKIEGRRIIVSQSQLNRLFHGTATVWEVLGAIDRIHALVADENGGVVRVPKGQPPKSPVVGVDVFGEKPGTGERYIFTGGLKFKTNIPLAGEKMRVKECRINGLALPLVAYEKVYY
jgi:hypothetical protein